MRDGEPRRTVGAGALPIRFTALTPSRRAVLQPSTWFEVGSSRFDAARPEVEDTADTVAIWSRVALEELRAVHRTLRAWHDAPAPHAVPPVDESLPAMLRTTRTWLESRSAAVLDGAEAAGDVLLAFPALDHPLLSDAPTALSFLHEFLPLRDGASLLAWTRTLAGADDVVARATAHAWVRIVLQKAAAERDLPEALAVLRRVYLDASVRVHLRRDDRAALAARGLEWCGWWAAALGLDAAPRGGPALPVAPVRTAASGVRPDVTVLIPSYNHGAFIRGTLDSVLGQSHAAVRVLVVDDHSTDDTVAQARAVDDPRVQVDVNPGNLGLGDSVLAALARVETPFVALLNSDDVFHPDRLAHCLAAFAATPAAQVVATGVAPIDVDGARLSPGTVSRLFDGRHIADWVQWHTDRCQVPDGADVLAELLERNFLITSSNIVARTTFLRQHAAGLRGLKYCLDWQLFLDAALAQALVVLRDELLGYRLHATNTVWFDEARAVSYRIEVNRVLLTALKAIAARTMDGPETVALGLDRLVRHAARHSEAAGFTMTAVDLWGGDLLESRRAGSASVHDLLRDLTRPVTNAASAADATEAGRQAARTLAAQVAAEMAREALAAAESERAHAEQARASAEHDYRAAQQVLADLHTRVAEHGETTEEFRQAISAAEAAAGALQVAHDAARDHADAQTQALDDERRRHDETRRAAARAAAEARAELERAQLEALEATRAEVERVQREAAATVAARDATHATAVAQLKSAPEWLLGDRLWNRAGLSRVGEPTVRALHTWRDRANRWRLALRGLARRAGVARPGAIVTACWSFPIHSQTFVYQEMTALAWTGLDTRVFCCDTNPKSELPAAFAGLWPKRLVMQTHWEAGQRDLAHFRRTRPARVDGLLALLAEATGRSAESLLQESIVLTGFTFARHVELARTSYLHTYFFYDQSFLALMAAYLLEIPRGITCYADHMLGDYVFKLVPLHLRLADIVVATSARIKDELVALGGDPAKVIVKPNGIDVARFHHVAAAERLALGGVPELVAVQRIEPKKGLIHLVDAMARLRDRGVGARLNVVGGVDVNTPTSAACHRELVARIGELQLGDAVILHGSKQQHEFAPIAARSRLFVAPYVETGSGDKDGIPTAVLEAMSTGLPIVATDAGSIAEASRDGIEAVIVPQRDAGALADAIARLLTDTAAWTRMSDAARARAVDAFDIHVTETRLHERIRTALARR